jgi:hypothetical protein
MELSREECARLAGKGVSAATLILYAALSALVAAIIKVLFSKRGKVSFAGLSVTWGN